MDLTKSSCAALVMVVLTSCQRAPAAPVAPRVPEAPRAPAASRAPAALAGAPAATVPPPRADGRLPSEVRPLGYALELVVDPASTRFSGRARIKVQIAAPVSAIVMHARGLEIRRATLRAPQGELVATAALRNSAGAKAEPDELTLAFDRPLVPGAAELDIAYDGPFGNKMRGLYRVQERGAWYAFTQFEPTDARRAFPCFDEPGFKTPFDVAITVPSDVVAFSNMKERSRRPEADGARVRFEFEPSPPLPTYLVALAVGTFDVVEGTAKDLGGLAVRIIATKGKGALASTALSTTLGLLGPLARYFQRPYPYGKLDLVGVPSFGSGAMENAGLLTFREERLLLDARASLASRLSVGMIVAHELAHQWFGDLVTMAWWDDLWLNEAFATWMAEKVVDEWRPATHARLLATAGKSRVMSEDALSTARRIRNAVGSTSAALEAFDGVTYVKGRAVLAMTEAWLGEETFRDGIRRYLAAHAWGSATASDLYGALAEASGGRPVARMMDTFATQTGFPVVDATLDCAPGRKPAVHLDQREYRTLERKAEPSDKLWQIPVCLVFPSAATDAKTSAKMGRQCALMETREARIELDGAAACPAFVYANAGEEGYYRVQLGADRLAPLARAFGSLPEAERFGVVSNAFAAVRGGDLAATDFLSLAAKLSKERSRLVWSEVIGALWSIDRALVSDAARPAFARFVRTLCGPTARRLGWNATRNELDDDHFLRESVLSLMGDLGDDHAVLAEADRLARRWLAGLDGKGGVSNDLARIALPLAAKHGDATLWQRMVALLKEPPTPEIRVLALSALTSFEDRALVDRTLALVLDGTVKAQDLRYLFPGLAMQRTSRDATLAWIEAHFDQVVPLVPSAVVGQIIDSVAGVCDAKRVRVLESFFASHTTEVEGVGKDLRQSVEAGLRCAALADAQRDAMSAWLTRQ